MAILIGFTCLLLAFFLVTVTSKRKVPNRFLAVFLILTAIELSGWLWVNAENQTGWLNGLRYALGFLQLPVFFGFYVSSCYSGFRFRIIHAFHLIPFLLALLTLLPGNQIPFVSNAPTSVNLSIAELNANWIGSHVVYYGYMAACVFILWQFHKRYKEQYSGGRSDVLVWLSQLAAVSLFAHTLVLIRNILSFGSMQTVVQALQVFGALLALAITAWIALKSLLQPHLFRDVDRRLVGLGTKPSQIKNDDLERLTAFMTDEKPWLDPELNLASLSDQLAMTPREVSELINQSLGVHFFDYVNGFRIRQAQELLTEHPKRSVLEILYEVGFNSKSSFNSAFKKQTSMTPTQYRRDHAKS